MAYLVRCGLTLTSDILALMLIVVNQGVADLFNCVCAYPRHSVREAKRWIGWRLGGGLSVKFFGSFFSVSQLLVHESTFPESHRSRHPIHNFILIQSIHNFRREGIACI